MSPKTILTEADSKKDKLNETNTEIDNPLIEQISVAADQPNECNTEYLADQSVGSSSNETNSKSSNSNETNQQSSNKNDPNSKGSNDPNLKDIHDWEFELEWVDCIRLKKVLDDFTHVILNTDKSCPDLQATSELLKHKDNLILTLSKLPFKTSNEIQSNANEAKLNKTSNNKVIKVLGRDLMIEIENQLIKNGHYLVSQNRDIINEDIKKNLIEENNILICKLVNLKNETKSGNGNVNLNYDKIINILGLNIFVYSNEEYVTIEFEQNSIKFKKVYSPIISLFLAILFLSFFHILYSMLKPLPHN